ncbi:Flp family type IVb pilin [Alkalicella caledoniensis]|uniref:Flp family type IVb pilin n=1 Tax=Alkalicella caledoniensis TaxID=2731377 RepID=A0A7G9W7E1_ALKCA|nr:Flp family type IVb pilin [Alkalicella caledoniensis]QNO14603.1 Flp family type IVb pilin [Alkalicella caledoniensis]
MMMTIVNYFLSKVREEKGQGMVEYALIIGLVSIVAMGILFTLGGTIGDVFSDIVARLGGTVE